MFRVDGFTFLDALKDRNAFTFRVKDQPFREKIFLLGLVDTDEYGVTILLSDTVSAT